MSSTSYEALAIQSLLITLHPMTTINNVPMGCDCGLTASHTRYSRAVYFSGFALNTVENILTGAEILH